MITWIKSIIAPFLAQILGVLALLFFVLAVVYGISNAGLKSQIVTLTDSLKIANELAASRKDTIDQNKKDYEALDTSCAARIKATTANLLAATPQCPNGQKPVYNVKDLVKP